MHRTRNFFLMITLLCLTLLSTIAMALKADFKEKLHITSRSTLYDYKAGTTIFLDDVKVDQGTTHITANKLTTKTNAAHQLQEAIAYGSDKVPAHYWTTPKPGDRIVDAKAKIIKYYPLDGNIILQESVFVTQGENSFQGQLVLYNMLTQAITVPETNNGRAILVYNPDEDKKTT